MLEKPNWCHLTGLITLVLLIWKWMSIVLRKHHLLRCMGWLALLNWIIPCAISTAKSASKKIRTLIHSIDLLSPEVALYLYKSTILPCMEYCCHVWAGAPSCYLELLDKLQKPICSTFGPFFAASLEPLAHCWNVA